MKSLFKVVILALLFALPATITNAQDCSYIFKSCASSLSGYTLVDGLYAKLDSKGAKSEVTLYSGNKYRFVGCMDESVSDAGPVVFGLADKKGNLLISNLSDDEKTAYRYIDVTCSSTDTYILVALLNKGTACAGILYGSAK